MSNNDDFEKELFELARKDKSVPDYVDKAIEDGINKAKSKKSHYKMIYQVRRVAIILICFGIITTSVVYAKQIANFFKSIFTSSTPGIEAASENGKSQKINMDFVYDKDIGIKADSYVEDDEVLDISFAFDLGGEKLENIKPTDFKILADGEEIFSKEANKADLSKINSVEIMNDIKKNKDYYYKSILIKLNKEKEYNNFKVLITKIEIYQDNKVEKVDGEWDINFNLNDKNNNENIENSYKMEYDKNVLEVSNTINDTNFVIDISFKEKIDPIVISEIDNISLICNNNKIRTEHISIDNSNQKITLKYDYGEYNLQNELTLYIKYTSENETTIKFYR